MKPKNTSNSGGASNGDAGKIQKLVEIGSSDEGLAKARAIAKDAWEEFPHNGCAAELSALLQLADIDVLMILGAGKLASTIESRGWKRIGIGFQRGGDVGVTYDLMSPPGADHIYLVLQAVDGDIMQIADNQKEKPHARAASGKDLGEGQKTPTEYFLRADGAKVPPPAAPQAAAPAAPASQPAAAAVASPAPGNGWQSVLASARTEQTLSRAQMGLGRGTVYHLGSGGNAGDIPQPLSARCDCSGFVCWAIGVPRECPPGSDRWLYTDSIWEGGGEVGHGLFAQVATGAAAAGDFYVYPAPDSHHHGHIAIVTAVQGGTPSQILHCSLSNYENTGDAVRITGSQVFTQNPQTRIVRPNYSAIRAAAGLSSVVAAPVPIAHLLNGPAPMPQGASTVFSIDTNLKTTRSPLDAERIRAFFEHQTEGRDALKDIGEPVMAASAKCGINATYIVAHAILESGWGRSSIARTKNNLYGWSAYDEDPSQAKAFASRAECIDFVMGRINDLYLTPSGRYYRVSPCLGNKHYGMNANYAAEADWGSDIASIARKIENNV